MVENDLHACQPRAYKVTTVQDEAAKSSIVDHVKRDFTVTAPGTKFVGDSRIRLSSALCAVRPWAWVMTCAAGPDVPGSLRVARLTPVVQSKSAV